MTKKPKASRAKQTNTKAKKRVPGGSPARAKAPVRAKPAKPAAAGGDPLDQFIEAAAQTLDLPVDPAWQPAVKMNLQVILRQASLFTDFSLPDEAEPAPVFTA
jgi:hypothetical protein